MSENVQAMEVDRTEYNWQAKVQNPLDALALTYANKDFANVIFLVGKNKKEVLGHDMILYSRSAVLNNSFNGDFKREFTIRDERQYQVIEVPDMEPPEFEVFLKFLYTNQLEMTPELAMRVLFVSKYYRVPILEQLVRDYVQKNLNPENVFMFYEQADVLKDDQVLEVCIHWIDGHAKEFFEADNFKNLNKQALCDLLSRDQLLIQEGDVFKSVIKWAKFQCSSSSVDPTNKNMRHALRDVLPLVRFPCMKFEEFGQLEDVRILEKEEILELNKFFSGGIQPRFSTRPRGLYEDPNVRKKKEKAYFVEKPNGKIILNRFGAISTNDAAMGGKKWVGIEFRVDRDIELLGYGVYGAKSGRGKYCGVIYASSIDPIVFESDGLIEVLYFDKPKLCKASDNYRYSAMVKLTGPPSYYGEQGQEKIVCQTSNGPVTFAFSSYSSPHYDLKVESGQVPQLIFRLQK